MEHKLFAIAVSINSWPALQSLSEPTVVVVVGVTS